MLDFNALIEKYLYRERKPKEIGRYYPSEVGNCLRKTWFSYKYPQDFDVDKQRFFEMGNILHEYIVKVFKSEKTPEVKLLKAEFPFQITVDDFIISGRIDDLLLLTVENKELLVEVKSTSNLKLITGPKPHHAMQLQFYMHATGVHDGALLYLEKNTLQSKVYSVQFTQNAADEAFARFKALHAFLKNDELPPAEAKLEKELNWFCKYCEYKPKCDLAGLAQTDHEKTKPKWSEA